MSLVFLGFLLLAACGAGRFVLARLRIPRTKDAAGIAFEATLGTAVLGTTALLLGGAGLLRPPVLIAVAVVGAVYGLREFPLRSRSSKAVQDHAQPMLIRIERFIGAAVILASATRLAWFAWYPDLRIDAFMYHITVPQQWLMRGWASAFAYEPHASFHLLWDVWYAYGLSLSRDDFILPALWHSAAAVGVAILIRGELIRSGHPRMGDAAAIAWLIAGEVLESSACAYVDNAVALYVVAGVLVLARATSRPEGFLAGLFLGAAVATKATSLAFMLAAIASWVLARLLARDRTGLTSIGGAVLLGAVLIVMPWILRNAITTGNPFYPFLPDLFQAAPGFDLVARDFLASYPGVFSESQQPGMSFRGFIDHANLFLANTRLLPQNFFAVVMLVAGLLAFPKWRRLPTRTLTIGLLGLGLLPLVVMSPARRFALPAEGLQILGVALLLGELLVNARPVRTFGPRALAITGAAILLVPAWRAGDVAQSSFENRRPPDDANPYLTPREIRTLHHERHPDAAAARLLEQNLGARDCVLVMENSFLLSIARVRIHPNGHMHSPNALRMMAYGEHMDADRIAQRVRAIGVTHVFTRDADSLALVRCTPVAQSPSGPGEAWHLAVIDAVD